MSPSLSTASPPTAAAAVPPLGNSTPGRARALTGRAQPNCLCQSPSTSLSIINLLHFGLETAESFKDYHSKPVIS